MLLSYYNRIIDDTMHAHNENIYKELKRFLNPEKISAESNPFFDETGLTIQGVGGQGFRGITAGSNPYQLVPTCLVVTSNESASSIETQFKTTCEELKQTINSYNIILDEKKCQTLKAAIEHIQSLLRDAFQINPHEEIMRTYPEGGNFDGDDLDSGDEVKIEIPNNHSSDEEEEKVEPISEQLPSSRNVSSLMDYSLTLEKKDEDMAAGDPAPINDAVPEEENIKLKSSSIPSQIQTRR